MADLGTAYTHPDYDDSFATPLPIAAGEYTVQAWEGLNYSGFVSLIEDGTVTEGESAEEDTRVYPRVPRERNTP